VIDVGTQQTRGGIEWIPMGLEEFRAYLSISLLMGIKKLPSTRHYWVRNDPLLHCPEISGIMTHDRFEQITRCLHIANAPSNATDHSSPTYEKLHKLRWMIDEVRTRFKAMWSLNQQITVDESMVMYNGKYCPVRQYMPFKPIRFGIKVWAAADAISKYLWNFEVYCGKQGNPYDAVLLSDTEVGHGMESPDDNVRAGKGEGLQGRNVIMSLLEDLHGRGHILTTDNFFTSVPLFLDLLEKGIMATGTLRWNRKYVPRGMFAKTITKKQTLGWVDYRMHKEHQLCCMVWKDK
jgi:hypothetical protein